MSISTLSVVEKKVLGALIQNSNKKMIVNIDSRRLAHAIGYKEPGGIVSAAVRALEAQNIIVIVEPSVYKVMI